MADPYFRADHDYSKSRDGRVRLTSSYDEWRIGLEAFREELCAIDRALKGSSDASRGPTHDEFASHLLDVHRMWCDACSLPPGGLGMLGVDRLRPKRDAGGRRSLSAVVMDPKRRNIYVSTGTQTTYGMYGLDMGVLDDADDDDDDDEEDLSITCDDEGEEPLGDVERYTEKPSNEIVGIPTSEASREAPNLRHTGDSPLEHHLDTAPVSSPSGSAEANKNKSQRHTDSNAQPSKLNDTTSKTLSSHYGHSCSVCGKRFLGTNRSTKLRRHMMIHAAARPVHCPICNKAFTKKILLALHMETSTHEASPINHGTCFICSKTFSMDALARHIRSHTKEDKIHRCDKCGKLFVRKDYLLGHMQTHHTCSEEPFKCSICKQTFPVQANLDMHYYLAHTLGENDGNTEPLSDIKVML